MSRTNNPFARAEQEIIYAPGTKITYDPTLVMRLKQDHVQLLQLFTLMLSAAKGANYPKLKQHLDAFQKLFNAHALSEYTKLYIFLEYAMKQDPANNELVRAFKQEMNEIGRAVRTFYVRWMGAHIDDVNVDEFLKQAEGMGKVLVHRVKIEEERLYEIYDMAPSLFSAVSLNH